MTAPRTSWADFPVSHVELVPDRWAVIVAGKKVGYVQKASDETEQWLGVWHTGAPLPHTYAADTFPDRSLAVKHVAENGVAG